MSLIKVIFNSIALLAILNTSASAQTDSTKDHRKQGLDALSLGFGTGLDYGGGLGLKLNFQPLPNFGFFFSGGFWEGGINASVGLKIRLLPKPQSSVSPFLTGIYGANEIGRYTIYGKPIFNKGISLGGGIDFFNTPKSFGYVSLGTNYALLPQTIYFTIGLNVIMAKAHH